MARKFRVDFYHKKPEEAGRGARIKIEGTIGQALAAAQSETAVWAYLTQKYQGEVITIMKLDWLD